jgi:heme exporter protein C
MKFSILKKLEPALFGLTALIGLYALYVVFMIVPNERIMGPVQRIFYFHVGGAMATYVAVGLVFVAALLHFATRNKFWDVLGASAAEGALIFCSVVMATGMIWGHAAWNTWFRWEPRLVSFLVLLLILLGINLLRMFGEKEKVPNHAAAFAILAAINVPLVIWSIDILPQSAQLHPKVVQDQGLKDPSFVEAMLLGMAAMILLQLCFVWVRTKVELVERLKDESV